jgi:AcrR family transcriptional regulator
MTATGAPDGRAARWSGQRDKRRAEFVDAALAAITEHGPAVSTEQIASHAGVTRTKLYRHFDNADDLHYAVTLRISELIVAEVAPALRRPADTPNQIIRSVVAPFVVWLSENVNLYEYGVRHHAENVTDLRAAIGTLLSALLDAYRETLRFHSDVLDLLAFSVVGLVESASVRWVHEPGRLSRDDLIEFLADATWALIDQQLRGAGVVLDPTEPLRLPDSWQ